MEEDFSQLGKPFMRQMCFINDKVMCRHVYIPEYLNSGNTVLISHNISLCLKPWVSNK